MKPMCMRDRILAVVQGREHDQVPLVMYDALLPVDEVRQVLGRERIGLLRWCRVYTVEHPHCAFVDEDYAVAGQPWRRTTLYTPAGAIYEERSFEPAYNTGAIRKHYVERYADYEVLWAYLADCVIRENSAQYHQDQAELGEDGLPLVAVERTPYQQLWVQWTGIDNLGYHLADWPERVQHTVDLLHRRARRIFEISATSPAPFVDFPDNITAPTIGAARFRQYCVPLYNELAELLVERDALVFVHMDGDLKPLWADIAASRVRGIDSLAPAPDNDTTVGQALAMWPEKRLFVNFPSSVHLRPAHEVRAVAEEMLAAGGHSGRLEIQISENVPHAVWRTSLPAIAEAIAAFGAP
ncbi:MAG: hypothetical protein V1772_07680 [Chloroflexota bacterium]